MKLRLHFENIPSNELQFDVLRAYLNCTGINFAASNPGVRESDGRICLFPEKSSTPPRGFDSRFPRSWLKSAEGNRRELQERKAIPLELNVSRSLISLFLNLNLNSKEYLSTYLQVFRNLISKVAKHLNEV